MKLTFCGGAGSVTGANYLLEHNGKKILIDCGLNQGTRYAEMLNYEPFLYDPTTIDYVFITHSHIDHIGRLPKLCKEGFKGIVYATEASKQLMNVALPDNMRLIVDEARSDNHDPLFNDTDVQKLMEKVKGISYNQPIDLEADITILLHDAGHILGSSIIEVNWIELGNKKRICFSGDLGNPPAPLLRTTEFVTDTDYIVIESAYGDRTHEAREERTNKLQDVVEETIKRKGVLMIPSFAVERTQELLFEFNELFKKIEKVPVFIDSPLAIKMTEVYANNSDYFNKEAKYIINSGDDIFKFPGLMITRTAEESKKINDVPGPKIIIAGSGMSQGGRILHHEVRYLSDPNSTILFIGYQVDGSLGRRIQQGNNEVTVLGQRVQVKCHIETISSYSAHADQPTLLNWVRQAKKETSDGVIIPKNVFVVQGELESSKTLASLIHDNLNITAMVPKIGDSFDL